MAQQEIDLRTEMQRLKPLLQEAYESKNYLQYLLLLVCLVPAINNFLDNARILK